MSQMPGSFRPSELEGADRQPSDAELASAWTAARELEAALPPDPIGPSRSFGDRVMAAVARERSPRPAGFLDALRARPGLSGLSASVREAWAVASAGVGRPVRVRGMALAYVVAVAVIGTSLTGMAALGAAGAFGLLDAGPTPSTLVNPTISPTPSATPSPSPSLPAESGSPGPGETAQPTGTPQPTESVEPDESDEPEPSDDATSAPPGATVAPSPDESDDHGGGSSDVDESPEPSDTPRPSDTPKPSQTHT